METKRSRRIRHSRQDWQGFVSEFLTSGQDCKSFCRDKGLNPSRLIRWQGVFRKWGIQLNTVMLVFQNGIKHAESPACLAKGWD
ncbi:MAG: hypothetical protein WJ289_02515 [Ferrovum myxofaciens]|uniref:hypothetical protein n=1 Tax=Ferrovum myxofaciens TaxID=416213 RepID=UPI003EBB3C30